MPELFLDSANLDDIRACVERGIISGVTVNQSLLAREPKSPYGDYIAEIIAILRPGNLHLSIPLVGEPIPKYSNLAVKIPVSLETIAEIRALSQRGIAVNATCVFTVGQAIVAAQAGARVVSVFVGRINDAHPDSDPPRGYDIISMIKSLVSPAKVLAGSIRDTDAVLMAAASGADIITTSRKVLEALADDANSQASTDKFNTDWSAWTA